MTCFIVESWLYTKATPIKIYTNPSQHRVQSSSPPHSRNFFVVCKMSNFSPLAYCSQIYTRGKWATDTIIKKKINSWHLQTRGILAALQEISSSKDLKDPMFYAATCLPTDGMQINPNRLSRARLVSLCLGTVPCPLSSSVVSVGSLTALLWWHLQPALEEKIHRS